MEFEVKFERKEGEIISFPFQDVGLEGLRLIREEFGAWIAPKDVKFCINFRVQKSVTVEINEKIATESGLFEKTNIAAISVTGDFTKYCKKVGKEDRCHNQFSINWEFSEEKIIRDWEAAGFPSEWEISRR